MALLFITSFLEPNIYTPENGWIQHQSPAGTLDDPLTKRQTSTEPKGLKTNYNSKASVLSWISNHSREIKQYQILMIPHK